MSFNPSRSGPATTPICRTPSTSISMDVSEAAWIRNNSISSTKMRCSIDDGQHEAGEEMDEDERMVEDLLCASPASPSSPPGSFARAPPPSGAPQTSSSAFRPRKTSLSMHMIPIDHPHHHELPSPNTSLFATTDPFYLASLQGGHGLPASGSAFAQAGRPSAHSPFLKHHMQYGAFGHSFQSVPPDVQPHTMFAATAAAFSS